MDLDLTQTIAAARSAVEAALVDPDFVATTRSLPRVADCRIVSAERDGEVWRYSIHRRFAADLPAVARAVVDPARLTWVEHVEYDLAAHRGRHRIVPDHYADRLAASYTSDLAETDGATTRSLTGTLTVHAALVAGRVERAILSGLEEYAGAEAELLARWCAGDRPA